MLVVAGIYVGIKRNGTQGTASTSTFEIHTIATCHHKVWSGA